MALLAALLVVPTVASAQGGADGAVDGPIVSIEGGKISYGRYRNRCDRPAELGLPSCDGEKKNNKLKGFSYAGYRAGGVALPDVPVGRSVEVGTGRGNLIPEDPRAGEHNRRAIRRAIRKITASADRPAAVQLPAGRFYVDEGLKLDRDGVVLRGAGQGADGTTLIATRPSRADGGTSSTPLLVVGDATGSSSWRELGERQRIAKRFVPTGTSRFRVGDPSAFEIGDRVMVVRAANQAWIDQLQINAVLERNGLNPWLPRHYNTGFERTVTAVNERSIEVDAPVVEPMYKELGGGYVVEIQPFDRVREVGVEDLRIQSEVGSYDTWRRDHVEHHTSFAITLGKVENGWVSGVTCRTMVSVCVQVGGRSRHVTVQDAASLDWASTIYGGRRSPFALTNGATGVLFQRLYSRGARHDVSTGSNVPGPNVFLDVYAEEARDEIGPHHRYATGVLFDNNHGGYFAARNRGPKGTGHGWSGAQTVFWNVDASATAHAGNPAFAGMMAVDTPPGAMNFVIGGTSALQDNGPGTIVIDHNAPGAAALPRSLYLAELEARVGRAGIEAVTTGAQRQGTIYDLLNSWAGSGPMPNNRPSELTLVPESDTYVQGGAKAGVFFENGESGRPTERLVVSHHPAEHNVGFRQALVQFDTAGVDRGAITQAVLRLPVDGLEGDGTSADVAISVGQTPSLWSEHEVRFWTRPELQRRTLLGAYPVTDSGEVEIDVTDYLRSASADHLTFVVDGVAGPAVSFHSSESSQPPRLVVRR